MNLEQGQELHGFTVLTAEPLPAMPTRFPIR